MDYYFTDRKFNVLGIASTEGDGQWHVSADSEIQSTDDRPAVALTLTIPFKTDQEQAIDEMAAENNFVLYQDEQGDGHQMVIASINHDTLTHIHTVICTDAGNDLMNVVVNSYKADKAYTIADYILRFTSGSGWKIGTNDFTNNTRTLKWDDTDTALNRIKSVADDFGAVLSFGFDFVGTTVVRRGINIKQEDATDSNVFFYMNKDVNNLVKSVDIYDMETAVYGTGATPDGSDTPINLAGYSWSDPDGRYVLGGDGVLRDTVAVQQYSYLISNGNPTPTSGHWERFKSFDSNSQAALLQAVLADLKKYNHPNVNYQIDLVNAPYVPLNQTVHIADENQNLFLSAKVLSIERSRAEHYTKITLGDYLTETSQVDAQLQAMADKLKNIPKTVQYYPWLRYADDDKGTNMSSFPSGKKYMAVVYSNKSSVPSDDPADYAGKWALIQGADGKDGVPGAKGADGRTSYFHTAWADDVSGQSGFTVSGGDGKKYIGTYSDFTQADSTNPADYNWALFKGEDGDVGPKGPQGLPGKSGADGRTTYAHFAYANSQDGHADFSTTDSNRKYIGFYSDFTSGDSTNPNDYSWSLIKGADGADGKDGVPGKAGVDGKTPYFHIAYADSGDGRTNFSLDTPGSRKYIGSYTDFTQADSTNPDIYSWQLVQGPKGDTGKDGVAGKDGVGIKSTQIMYAQSTSGTATPTTGWTAQVPTLIKGHYLWTQTTWLYTDNTGESGYTVSYNAKDGNTGANGIAGKDGTGIKSTVIEYSVSSNGVTKPSTGWSATIPSIAPGQFMWTRTTWSYTDGTNEVGYSVAQAGAIGPKGDTGPQGPQGVPGSKDVPMTYIQLGTPASPKRNDLWWHGTTLNDATALQYYDGSTWIDQSIQQAVLSIKKLQSIEIDSATINSPYINEPFYHTALDDANLGKFSSGSTSMQYGHVNITGNVENYQGNADGHMMISDLGPSGFISRESTHDNVGNVQYANLQGGKLYLSTMTSDENAATKKYVYSTFKSTDNVTYYWSNTTPYSNADIDWAYIIYARRNNFCTVSFDLLAKGKQGWLDLAQPRAGYKPYLAQSTGAVLFSTSYSGATCAVYYVAGGYWRLIPSVGSGEYRGSFSYLTQDEYPTGDTFF